MLEILKLRKINLLYFQISAELSVFN